MYTFESVVWLYPGMAGWRFISLPKEVSEEIRMKYGNSMKGWGSIPVIVTVGKTTWETSVFPDKKSQSYLLPMKLEVRKKEGIMDGDKIDLRLRIRV
jgi:hypothetical protein